MQKTLVSASHAGLWNHLALPMDGSDSWAQSLLDFTGSNPQIVHSWYRPTPWPWSPRPIKYIGEPRAEAYRQVAPSARRALVAQAGRSGPPFALPGTPRLRRGAPLAGAPRWRQRIPARGETCATNSPNQRMFAPEVMEEIALLVLAAGKVKPQWLRHNQANAYLVSYCQR